MLTYSEDNFIQKIKN